MTLDVVAARADTPGAERVLHLNNAGSSLPPRIVLDTAMAHLRREAEIGGYEAADEARPRIEAVYDSIARLLNAARDEIAVVENATRAWDMAFYSLRFAAGERILTAQAEYASNALAFLQIARRTGAVVEVAPDDAHGQVDVAALERMIDARVKLIALTHVPTNGGLVNPAEAVGRIARKHGVPYLLDACQSAGQMKLDVAALGCDMLSATGRKFLRGPRGVGFLYVRRALIDALEPPFLDLHAANWVARDRFEINPTARRFENWESNVAATLGLGAAVDYALALGLPAIEARVSALAAHLREALAAVPGVRLRDKGARLCGIVTFTIDGLAASEAKAKLRAQAINVSASSAASTRWDMDARGLGEVVRASVHYYNTDAEIARFCAALRALTPA